MPGIVRQDHRADVPINPGRVKFLVPRLEMVEGRLAKRHVLDVLPGRQARAPSEHDDVEQAVAHQAIAAVNHVAIRQGVTVGKLFEPQRVIARRDRIELVRAFRAFYFALWIFFISWLVFGLSTGRL